MARKGENIYKRKDGRWEGRYRPNLSEGKYRSVYGKSYSEVKEKLIKLRSKPITYHSSGTKTFRELTDEWLMAVRVRVKATTLSNYQMKLSKHILPVFGDIRFNCITVQLVQEFVNKKLKSGLSAKYVRDIVVLMKSISKYICRIHGYRDVIADAEVPKSEKKEMTLLTDGQQKILCKYLTTHISNTSLCILLSLFMGLRIGEICGLKWGDIDFSKSTLTVRRTVQRINKGCGTELYIGTPKSASSRRCIPVPDSIMAILRQFQSDSDKYILSDSTKVIEPRTLQRRFKSILKKADLPSVNYHSLRHMFATNCIRAGFDVKTLSAILGHSSVETTLNRYVHSSFERKVECMNLLHIAA